MTEAEWLTCTDPTPMLEFLNQRDASERKFRLYSTACARRLWPVMSSDHARTIVLDAEEFAAGLLSQAERRNREEKFRATFPPRMTPDYPVPVSYLADMVAYYTIWSNSCSFRGPTLHLNEHGAKCVSQWVAFTLVFRETDDWQAWPASVYPIGRTENDTHCRLLRCIFGNPFRPSPPAVLGWSDGTIPRIAAGIYEERRMPEGTLDAARLAILADALLDAGCDDEGLLAHLRSEGPHVRGCWAVDLLLGKEECR